MVREYPFLNEIHTEVFMGKEAPCLQFTQIDQKYEYVTCIHINMIKP